MIADRMKTMKPATTVRLSQIASDLREQGTEVIHLGVGEPDFPTPDHICEAAKRAIDERHTQYTAVQGLKELRVLIAKKLREENNVDYDISEIDVTVGAKQGVYNAICCVVNPGDEVLVLIPSWFSYDDMVRLCGGVPVLVPTKEPAFVLDLEAIEKAITPKTKAIIINTPNNPTGAVYDEASLRALAELCVKHHLYIISDEIYEKLIYSDEKHFSIASISPEVRALTFTINGFSKAYAMTGWRVGYVAAPKEYINAISKFQNRVTSGNANISQRAAIAALAGDQSDVSRMAEIFRERRDYMVERINAMEGISCVMPYGAFYVMPDIRSYLGKSFEGTTISTSTQFAEFILSEAHVLINDGESFNYPGYVRLSYSNSLENIKKAMDRMEEALKKLV